GPAGRAKLSPRGRCPGESARGGSESRSLATRLRMRSGDPWKNGYAEWRKLDDYRSRAEELPGNGIVWRAHGHLDTPFDGRTSDAFQERPELARRPASAGCALAGRDGPVEARHYPGTSAGGNDDSRGSAG